MKPNRLDQSASAHNFVRYVRISLVFYLIRIAFTLVGFAGGVWRQLRHLDVVHDPADDPQPLPGLDLAPTGEVIG